MSVTRFHRPLVAFAVLAGIAAPVGAPAAAGAPARSAADTTAPALVDVTLSRSAVRLAGLNLVPVTVSVRLTDDTGVQQINENQTTYPVVNLDQVAGGPGSDWAELDLTSGTATDGVWSATVHVPSTWHGTWQVARVLARDAANNRLEVDPRTRSIVRSLTVTGTDPPALTMRFDPDPSVRNRPTTIRGRAWYAQSGKPIARKRIFVGSDNLCVEGHPGPDTLTDARGYYAKRYSASQAGWLKCAGFPRPSNAREGNAYIVVRAAHPRYHTFKVSASPARSSVPAGRDVAVNGGVAPVQQGAKVQLQRLVGRTWRTVGQGSVRASGRFTVTATPATVGNHLYRARVPGTYLAVTGNSKTFTIRGT